MSRRRHDWTDAEDDLLRRLTDSGSSPREIGERIGRSESGVRNRKKMLRIPRCGGRVRKPENWSEEELTELRELHAEGMMLTEIAERLGRTRTSVAVKARALELWRMNPSPDAGDHVPKRPARAFSEIEMRRIRQFLARGDTLADIARQMRCELADIRRFERSPKGRPRARARGGAGSRGRPKTASRAAHRQSPSFPTDCVLIPWRPPMRFFSE